MLVDYADVKQDLDRYRAEILRLEKLLLKKDDIIKINDALIDVQRVSIADLSGYVGK